MAVFARETLEAYKYTDLVKVAKEHDVYRRYAPKAELIEKLLSLSEPTVENLNDVSMPSFMESDDIDLGLTDQDTENAAPQDLSQEIPDTSKNNVRRGRKHRKKYTSTLTSSESFSPRSPLSDKAKNVNPENVVVINVSPVVVKTKSGTPQSLRRSLAGPAVVSKPKLVTKGRKLKRQIAVDHGSDEEKSSKAAQSPARRLTRQRTYDVDPPKEDVRGDLNLKRQRTFDVDSTSSNSLNLKRQGKFQEKQTSIEGKLADAVPASRSRKLKREGTFEVVKETHELEEVALNPRTRKLRREGTFEVEHSSTSKDSTSTSESNFTAAIPSLASKERLSRLSQAKQPERQSRRLSVATPGSAKVVKITNEESAPRRFFTSRIRPIETVSSGRKSSAGKTKIPSVMNDIQRKKAEVSFKKIADASEKIAVVRKVPDFNAIHRRLFGKMESVVDSRQKVIDRANSVQKSQQKFGKRSPPANSKVVRKLISPKAGKSAFQQVAPSFSSNVVAIQKRPSIGNGISGISKLQSPKLKPVTKLQSPQMTVQFPKVIPQPTAVAGTTNRFGFTMGPELSRKDAVKASVLGRKPINRISPLTKAKNMLQTVRLNKRFELQMKHRIAQQASN